jgi:hypothetical protein
LYQGAVDIFEKLLATFKAAILELKILKINSLIIGADKNK